MTRQRRSSRWCLAPASDLGERRREHGDREAEQSLERGRDRDGLGGAGRSGGGANQVLTITAGQTSSTGAVTITAKNNGVDAPDRRVTVTGAVTGGNGVAAPAARTLTIPDRRSAAGGDAGARSGVHRRERQCQYGDGASLDRPSSERVTVTVSAPQRPHLLGRLVARDADAMIKQARPASRYIVVRLRIPWQCKRRAGSGPKRDEPVQPPMSEASLWPVAFLALHCCSSAAYCSWPPTSTHRPGLRRLRSRQAFKVRRPGSGACGRLGRMPAERDVQPGHQPGC